MVVMIIIIIIIIVTLRFMLPANRKWRQSRLIQPRLLDRQRSTEQSLRLPGTAQVLEVVRIIEPHVHSQLLPRCLTSLRSASSGLAMPEEMGLIFRLTLTLKETMSGADDVVVLHDMQTT